MTEKRFGPWDGTGVPPTGVGSPRTAPEPEPPAEPAEDAGYDPGEHNVDEVRKYISANPDQAEYVLDRERGGKARTSLIGA